MAIEISTPPELPSAADPSTFNTRAIAFFQWITTDFVSDLEGISAADIMTAGMDGRLTGVQTFTHTSGDRTYTPTEGTKYVVIEQQAAGGGGGNGNSSGASEVGVGTGGGAGNTIRVMLDVSGITSATITHGAAGSGGTTGGANGADGGAAGYSDGLTSWTVPGGSGGAGDDGRTTSVIRATSNSSGSNSITEGSNHIATLKDMIGESGDGGVCIGTDSIRGGSGGDCPYGNGGRYTYRNADGINTGSNGRNYGSGGSGGSSKGSQAGGADGGDGAPAITIIMEYSD